MNRSGVPAEPGAAAPCLALEQRTGSERLFQQLLDGAPDAVVVIDEQGRIVFANDQAERLFQYDRASFLGLSVEALVPERLRHLHSARRQQFAGAPHARPMGSGLELVGRKRDGSEFPVEIGLSPVAASDGLLISASIRDISERKAAGAALLRVQAHLLGAVESIQAAVAIFDAGDRLVVCNSAYRQLVAAKLRGEVTGRSFRELLGSIINGMVRSGDAVDEALEARWSAYHVAPSGALDWRTADGQHLRVVERRIAEGGTVTTISDITDHVRDEDELRRARALAEAASSAKSEFLASMSHELRTPLNSILGFAQLLERDRKNPLSEPHLRRVRHVLQGGEHLLRLIDDVLDLARVESGRVVVSPERLDVAEMLADVKGTLDPLAGRAQMQVLVAPVAPTASLVAADRTRLRQILMNFGSNAIKYGRPGGTARFWVSAAAGMTRIAVSDDGVGIALDKQPLLFQPFQRAGQETGPIEGTGIGLFISKRLAELMGGNVGCESVLGQGSTFWIELPRPPAATPSEPTAKTSSSGGMALTGAGGPPCSVLYVEDNPSNIAFMRDLMAEFDRIELTTAATAELAIAMARARPPAVIIMDINLPGMSGLEACHELKRWPETRDIPVIALSAAASFRDSARVAGFYRYLTKPVQVEELIGTLEALIRSAREHQR